MAEEFSDLEIKNPANNWEQMAQTDSEIRTFLITEKV